MMPVQCPGNILRNQRRILIPLYFHWKTEKSDRILPDQADLGISFFRRSDPEIRNDRVSVFAFITDTGPIVPDMFDPRQVPDDDLFAVPKMVTAMGPS